MQDMHYMDRNLAAIRTRIREAKEESRKRFPDRDGVTLLAAVKYADTEQLRYLTEVLGIRDVGENRVQQMLEHWEALPDRENLRFHFIGTLQKNKVKYIIDKVDMIQSCDSLRLANEIAKRSTYASPNPGMWFGYGLGMPVMIPLIPRVQGYYTQALGSKVFENDVSTLIADNNDRPIEKKLSEQEIKKEKTIN